MNKTEEILELVKKHPDHELIFMYPNEGSDHVYTLGYPRKVVVDEYRSDDDRVWLRYDEADEIREHYGDLFFDDLFPDKMSLSDEEDKQLADYVEVYLKKQDWTKCICVFIQY